jgi:hypothetical protein
MWETTMRIEQSAVVHGEPDQVWALLSSPAAWSLRPDAPFIFAVPEAPALRLYIGPSGRGTGPVLFDISDEVHGAMVRMRALPSRENQDGRGLASGSERLQVADRGGQWRGEHSRSSVKRWLCPQPIG